MKVIELLERIANNEDVPEKIKYRNIIYHINYEYGDYESDIEEYRISDYKEHYYLFEDIDMLKCLNDEIEIIEDKKIEKLPNVDTTKNKYQLYYVIQDKINEIIDYINKEMK